MEKRINEMLKMQKALNDSVKKKFNLESVEVDKIRLALIDEIGELTHELKGDWCWWKENKNPVDKEKVLEELVDVWHFALSLYIEYCGVDNYIKKDDLVVASLNIHLPSLLSLLSINMDNDILEHMLALTYKLGFTFEDVYNGYIKKNKVNYERLKNGY